MGVGCLDSDFIFIVYFLNDKRPTYLEKEGSVELRKKNSTFRNLPFPQEFTDTEIYTSKGKEIKSEFKVCVEN